VCLLAEALGRGAYLGGGLGPFEGLGIVVVAVDEGADVGLPLPDRGMNAVSEPFLVSSATQHPTCLIQEAEVGVRKFRNSAARWRL
jgi:hypothetical protein